MRSLALTTVLSVTLTACLWQRGGAHEPVAGQRGPFAAPGQPLRVDGLLETEEEDLATELPVTVSADRKLATLEVDGRTETLAWESGDDDCGCRFFRNDDWAVMVRSSKGAPADEARATVLRLSEDDSLVLDGLIHEAEGLDVRVRLAVADDRTQVRFDHDGESVVLPLAAKAPPACADCKVYEADGFRATVRFPAGKDAGRAEIDHLPQSK